MKYCNITLFRYTLQISFKDGLCNVFLFSSHLAFFLYSVFKVRFLNSFLKFKIQYLNYCLNIEVQTSIIYFSQFCFRRGVERSVVPMYTQAITTKYEAKLVGSSGLEPPTSRLSGVRSNHLSYEPTYGGDKRDRTADPLLAKQVLSQLSYTPELTIFVCTL